MLLLRVVRGPALRRVPRSVRVWAARSGLRLAVLLAELWGLGQEVL